MKQKEKEDLIDEALQGAAEDTAVALWNEYCEANKCYDERIYDNDEAFFDVHFTGRPRDAVRAAMRGEYNLNSDFVWIDGRGSLQSFDCATAQNSPVDYSSLGKWLAQHHNESKVNEYLQLSFDDDDTEEEDDEGN